jgi:hypothetical protein
MTTAAEQVNQAVTVYTPLSIISIFNSAFRLKEEGMLINIKGMYQPGQGKDYSGFFYDNLKDEANGCTLGLKVSAMDRVKLKPGSIVEIRGFITRKLDDKGIIKVLINLQEVVGQISSGFTEADVMAFKLMQAKANQGFKDVESFLVNSVMATETPVIKIFVGNNAIIDQDIRHAMGESITFFKPEFRKINLSNVDEIQRVLMGTECDVLVIARGGGSGLEVFNTIGLAEAALECEPMLITAIGHRADVSVMDSMADKQFITPTDLGNFFKHIYNKAAEQLTNSKSKLIEEVSKQVHKQFEEKLSLQEKLLKDREKQISQLQGSQMSIGKVAMYVIIALVLGMIIASLFFK